MNKNRCKLLFIKNLNSDTFQIRFCVTTKSNCLPWYNKTLFQDNKTGSNIPENSPNGSIFTVFSK